MFYPRVICPFTGSTALEWRIASGLGTVYATTVTHPAQGEPYNVALIDCDEGFRLMSRVEEIDPMQVRIGMRVRFRVHRPGGDEPAYPVFMPAGGRADERPAARRRGDRRGGRERSRPGRPKGSTSST